MTPLPDPICTVVSVRRSVPVLRLARASELAAQTDEAVWHGMVAQRDDGVAFAHTATATTTDLATGADAEPTLDLLAADDPHDAFFRVARVAGDPVGHYRRGLATAQGILREATAGDPEPPFAVRALQRTLQALAAPHIEVPLNLTLPVAEANAHRPLPEAVRRWVRGHQLFAVLTQGLVLAVKAFQRAAQSTPDADPRFHLQRLADLYTASALAMRFTSDFPREHYDRALRPAMSEPHAPAGFSGALSADHAVLVQQLMRSRPAFERAALRCPEASQAVKAALGAMYEDHKRVCDRLAGLSQPSIRSASLTRHQPTAGDLLDRFHERRSQLLR